jgi:hypothetical protein
MTLIWKMKEEKPCRVGKLTKLWVFAKFNEALSSPYFNAKFKPFSKLSQENY